LLVGEFGNVAEVDLAVGASGEGFHLRKPGVGDGRKRIERVANRFRFHLRI
jgi:hypothetical protein